MARRVRDATLETRTARGKLKARGKPYYRSLSPGLHIGYRKNAGGGRWVARIYTGGQTYRVEAFADADDVADANGASILNFWQAQQQAHELKDELELPTASAGAPAMTVADAVSAYIAKRDARDSRRSGRPVRSDASRRLTRHVLGQEQRGRRVAGVAAASLAAVALNDLSEADLKTWRAALPGTLKATTVIRLANDLKAALNAAHEAHEDALGPALPKAIRRGLKAGHDDAEDTEGVARARDNQILTAAELGRLLATARDVDVAQDWDGDLFRMVLVLAATGARFSQIARMRVDDVQTVQGRLMVPASRKGRGKSGSIPVPVGEDVLAALAPVVRTRPGGAPLLERWRLRQVSGTRWVREDRAAWRSASELVRPWAAIRERSGLPDAIVPYALRNSSIVRAIEANLPVRLVAATHDTSVLMIEAHYSKWITSGLEELTRAAIKPLVPPAPGGNVIALKDGA